VQDSQTIFSHSLEENVRLIQKLFEKDGTCKFRYFATLGDPSIACCAFFLDGMVDGQAINDSIIRPVTRWKPELKSVSSKFISENVIQSVELFLTPEIEKALDGFLSGDTLVFIDGDPQVVVVDTKGFPTRSIDEPENEQSIRGPKEGFNESIIPNLAILRRKLANHRLKYVFSVLGEKTKTKVCLIYLEGTADMRVVKELEARLARIQIDGVLDINYIQEMIRDHKWSPFKTSGVTERPDVLAAKLLEGRAAVMIDGCPAVMTVPFLFIENFQSTDDYYNNYYFSAVSRMLRIAGFFFSTVIPALYVALVTIHQEMLPTHLLLAIGAAREGVPLPTVLEAILLLFAFEVLREAGARTPSSVGTALSIVGALVLGQAAVEARFVSAPMVIVVAFAGITALMANRLQGAMLVVRFSLVLLAAALGVYGVLIGMMLLGLHLASLTSFGIPLIATFSGGASREDLFIRMPWFTMKKDGRFLAQEGKNK